MMNLYSIGIHNLNVDEMLMIWLALIWELALMSFVKFVNISNPVAQ